jgi:SWI/SNF-related matrix-associated actin-dependent regulator of chromatin subfamily A3
MLREGSLRWGGRGGGWTISASTQAMDRVHRLGQTRPVTVVRYVVEATLEERLLAMQEQKAALGKSVLKEQSADEARRMRLGELQDLFAE